MATSESEPGVTSLSLNSYATALCFIPPQSCWPPVDRLRALYDKAYRKWPPHVNLVYPFVQPESLDAAARRIQSFLRAGNGDDNTSQDNIDMSLDTAGVFSHRHEKTLFLHDGRDDGSAETLRKLRAGIVAALKNSRVATGDAAEARPEDDKDSYRMHMTVAQSSGAATGNVPATETDAASSTATPNDTLGHAHRFLLHKVEMMPPVAWQADRLHILVRERITKTQGNRSDGEVTAASSRMRLWGVLHLADGRIEKLDRSELFYDEVPFDNDKQAGEVEADEEDADEKKDYELDTFQAVTFAPEDAEWIRCSDDHDLYSPLPPASSSGSLSIATYNVLGEFEWPPCEDRFPLLIKNVLAANAAADVLVLQEVTDHFLAALLADDSVRAAYPFASHGPPDQEDMEPLPSLLNMVVLSRRPFDWSWLGFHRAHKGALIARFDHDDDSDDEYEEYEDGNGDKKYGLVLAAVHLTHGLTNGSVASKRAELQRLLGHLRRQYPPRRANTVLLAGDLNIHSSAFAIEAAVRRKGISPQAAQYVETGFDELFASNGFVDAYCATRGLGDGGDDEDEDGIETEEVKHDRRHENSSIPLYDGEEGATYNPFTNALAARIIGSGLNTRPERFDRILVRGPAKQYEDDGDDNEDDEDDDDGRSRYAIYGYNTFGFPPPGEDHSSPDTYGSDHWGIRCILERVENDEDEEDPSAPAALAASKSLEQAATEAEKPLISAEVEKLIVPVEPTKAPTGPLADAAAVDAALAELQVLPSDDEIAHRKAAFDRLKAIILDEPETVSSQQLGAGAANKGPRQLVVVPVGSYGLGVWTPASDIDCLCIGTFGPQTFFSLASQRLRAAGAAAAAAGDATNAVKIIRRVRAHTGTMLELEINGIRMDLQYCGAAVVAETWPSLLVLPPTHLVFALSPQTLSKLKAARDLYYLRKSFPEVAAPDPNSKTTVTFCTANNFRTAHRAIKTWTRNRGLYAARFGYLGGIQIAILLARVMKLMQREVDEAAAGETADGDTTAYTVSDILATFFRHYADFDWKTKMAFDPFFHGQKSPYAPSGREPLAILGYHRPQLNTSMAASVPSVRVLAEEFQRASRLLQDAKNGLTWTEFLSGGGGTSDNLAAPLDASALAPGPAEFVRGYRTYVKLDLHYWGLSLARGSAFVGWLESRCVLLLVDLARRLPELNARIWPGRFVEADKDGDGDDNGHEGDDSNGEEDRQYQGCYLIGLDLPAAMAREERRVALGTLQSVLAHFEKQIRRGGDGHASAGNYDPQWQWIGVSIANRADLGDVDRLRLDSRAWGEYTPGDEEDDDDEDDDDEEDDEENGNNRGSGEGGESAGDGDESDASAGGGKTKATGKGGKKAKGKKKLPMAVVHRPGAGGAKFRTAQDVIKRLRWDPHLDRSDFIVGYEDRFLGARERPLETWKSEQTDEEFIPQHRILYFRRRSDGAVVWDRRTRKDEVFGSGV